MRRSAAALAAAIRAFAGTQGAGHGDEGCGLPRRLYALPLPAFVLRCRLKKADVCGPYPSPSSVADGGEGTAPRNDRGESTDEAAFLPCKSLRGQRRSVGRGDPYPTFPRLRVGRDPLIAPQTNRTARERRSTLRVPRVLRPSRSGAQRSGSRTECDEQSYAMRIAACGNAKPCDL